METEKEELLHQITNWKKETEALSLELEYSKESLKMAERSKRDRKIIYQRQKEELISENEVIIYLFFLNKYFLNSFIEISDAIT